MSKRPILPISDFGIAQITLPNGIVIDGLSTDPNNPNDAAAAQNFLNGLAGITVTQPATPQVAIPQIAASQPYMLSQAIDDFIEVKSGTKWKEEKTVLTRKAEYSIIIEILGDIPVSEITDKHAMYLMTTLANFPSNRKKKSRYHGKTITEIKEMVHESVLKPRAANNYINAASALSNWLIKKERIRINHFRELSFDLDDENEDRDAFDQEHLRIIFNGPVYNGYQPPYTYCYWAPLIARYTGLRLGEICQLHSEDIYEKEGIFVFDINKMSTRKLKTRSSKRLVPIHSEILRCEFLEYVSLNSGQIFPEVEKNINGWSDAASKWFASYLDQIGLTSRKLTFHSFRHTFSTELENNDIKESIIKRLLGHAFKDTTNKTYVKKAHLKLLPFKDAIETIDKSATAHITPYGRWRTK